MPVHLWDVSAPNTGNTLVIWDQSTFDNHNQIINIRLMLEEVDADGSGTISRDEARAKYGTDPQGNEVPDFDQRYDEALSLNYTSPPLEENVELTGNPSAILYVASSAKTAYFHVKVTDVVAPTLIVAIPAIA